MGRNAGGVLNNNNSNSNTSEAVKKSRVEFLSKIASGEYIPNKSKFYMSSGGFYLTHYKHNDSTTDNDKSTFGVDVLAEKGYKIYLESEESYAHGMKSPDGKIDGRAFEIKTINEKGKYTIKGQLEKAAKQGAGVVVLVQGNKKCNEQYFLDQISLFKEKSPKKATAKIKEIIIVWENRDTTSYK